MNIKINGKKYTVSPGEMIYETCKRNGIDIPTLCSSKETQEGVCRVCVVEIAGKLVTSCNTKIQEGMEIITESEKISKARRINLELLWSDHAGKCATCEKNRVCDLQDLAEKYKIENFHFVPRKGEMTNKEELDLIKDNWSRVVVEKKNPCISRNSEFCIECRRCIDVCPEKALGFNYRAGNVIVGTPYEEVLNCSFCGECVRVCPTASLTDKNDFGRIMNVLDDLQKFSVAILDFDMQEKILRQIRSITPEKNLEKLFFSLGFEKFMVLSKKDKDKEDMKIEEIKTDYAKSEKISPKSIRTFFVSSKIKKKAEKNKYLDYVLSEREVARLLRDKKKTVKGKIHPFK